MAAKKNGNGAAAKKGKAADPTAKLAATALAQIEALEKTLAALDLASLTADERVHTNGKLREGEAEALVVVLDAVDAHPSRFAALAAHDHGVDDSVVETAPARRALARRAALAPIASALSALASRVNDDVLASAALAKDVAGPAYAIIRANSGLDKALKASASKAIDFYSKAARRRPAAKPAPAP